MSRILKKISQRISTEKIIMQQINLTPNITYQRENKIARTKLVLFTFLIFGVGWRYPNITLQRQNKKTGQMLERKKRKMK